MKKPPEGGHEIKLFIKNHLHILKYKKLFTFSISRIGNIENQSLNFQKI